MQLFDVAHRGDVAAMYTLLRKHPAVSQAKDIEGTIGKFFSKFTGAMFLALSSGYLFDKESTHGTHNTLSP